MKKEEGLHKRHSIFAFAEIDRKTILEVGCGDGLYTQLFLTNDNLVMGIDPDIKYLEMARKSFPQVNFLPCGLQDLAHGYSFDLIVFVKSFHELQGIGLEQAIIKCRQMLNPNGKILIIEEDLESPMFKIGNFNPFRTSENKEVKKILTAKKCIEKMNPQTRQLETDIAFDNLQEFCEEKVEIQCLDDEGWLMGFVGLIIKEVINVDAFNGPFVIKEILHMYLI